MTGGAATASGRHVVCSSWPVPGYAYACACGGINFQMEVEHFTRCTPLFFIYAPRLFPSK